MFQANLTNCDREPIHIPGSIQSHGFLLAVDNEFNIRFCSANAGSFLGVETEGLLGSVLEHVEQYVSRDKMPEGFLRQLILLNDQDELFRRVNTQVMVADQPMNLIINSSGPYFLLEFEPEVSSLHQNLQQEVGRSLSEMLADKQLDTLLQNTADQIRQIIGYDRVMVYRFHDDGHGEVVSESRNDDLESWLGLHYPASDIPQQARELYKKNLVRLIADVNAEPSGLLASGSDMSATSLDLTHSNLRAVSPVHIQYLKNMGVMSSFSVSLMDQDKLWGLVACHNYTPRFINFRQRESAKLIGQVLSSAVSFRQQEEFQKESAKVRLTIENITRHLLRNEPVPEALMNEETNLQTAIKSTGAVLYFENQLYTTGSLPERSFIEQLINWLNERMDAEVFETHHLSASFPPAAEHLATASGIVASRLSPELKEFMIWFRPELVSTVKWAGNPEKTTRVDEQGLTHIEPRHSFEAWSEQVREQSEQWTSVEIEAARMLRDEVNHSISRKATELRLLNERLREAYAELDTFSYTISHDLKNPLTTIKSFSQLIQREAEAGSKIHMMADRVQQGATKMQHMISEVLAYSKVGQSKVNPQPVDMEKLLGELRRDLLVTADNAALKIEISGTPPVSGDETMILQVFTNLLSNAVKYSSKNSSPLVSIEGSRPAPDIVQYRITDNGIGIPAAEHEKIFELFSRLPDAQGFEGSGVGLAIVKRIVQKHSGKIWLESEPGIGSSFFVSFPF